MTRRDEVEKQIAVLQAELDSDGDDDYEIEIRDGDKATRLPRSAGAPWLKKNFPDLFEELLGDGDSDAAADDDDKVTDIKKQPPHFRRRQA